MPDYIIYTDSAADIPREFCMKYTIRIIPMDCTLNGKSFLFDTNAEDRETFCKAFYKALRDGADVHTSQIPPFRYIENWRPVLQEGKDILYLSFSSGMSSTWQNAISAAEELSEQFPERKIRVVDTLGATAGQGVIVCAAAMNQAEKDMPLEENAKWVEDHVKYLCHRFTVGDLDYLHKGGRVSAAVALVGGLLNIKPCMIIDDEGKLQVVSKARGKHAALKSLVSSYVKEMGIDDVPKFIFVTHSCNDEDIPYFQELLSNAAEPGTQIFIMTQTPIIGAHTGPWFFSVCGWGKHRKEL